MIKLCVFNNVQHKAYHNMTMYRYHKNKIVFCAEANIRYSIWKYSMTLVLINISTNVTYYEISLICSKIAEKN